MPSWEHSCPWEVNNAVELNQGNGIVLQEATGFEMPDVRIIIDQLSEDDGGRWSDAYFGARHATMRGVVQQVADVATRDATLLSLGDAFNAGKTTLIPIKSSPTGLPPLQVTARLQGRFTVTDAGGLKQWFVALVCPDPIIYTQEGDPYLP